MSAVTDRSFERVLHTAVNCARLRPPLGTGPPCEFRTIANRVDMSLVTGSGPWSRDVDRRQAMIDCGAALLNARVVIAREELIATVTRDLSDAAAPRFARIEVRSPEEPDEPIPDARLGGLADRLRWVTLHKGHTPDVDLPRAVAAKLAVAAAQEDAVLVRVARADHLAVIDRLERLTARDPDPYADRRQRTAAPPRLPIQRRAVSGGGTLLLLGTRQDGPMDWLRTGEALQRVRLELARLDLVGRPLAELLAAPEMWAGLRRALSLDFSPQILIRVLGAGEP